MKNMEDEIVLLNKAVACLEEEVQAKNEIIRQQERIIKAQQEHNGELSALMNRIQHMKFIFFYHPLFPFIFMYSI
ncbi:hypothetical protein IMSAG025_01694 [Muribaculaceae bacterium]|nr:hypothetical protein IMSAG025_01694 [Muribaculaceae bacterium]